MVQATLLHCDTVCGAGVREGTVQLAWLSTGFQSLPPLATSKLGPSGADSPGGWICLCFRTLWVSPVNSPVRLGISPATATPTGFYSQRFWGFSFLALEPWVAWSVLLPSCSSWFICMQMWDHPVYQPPPCPPGPPAAALPCNLSALASHVHPSYQSGWMFLPNSLGVGLLYSSMLWYLWVFFKNLLLSFFLLCEAAKCIYLCLHLGWKSIC